MPIIITSKRAGFRRCGIEHPAQPVEHSDDKFTDEQLKKLLAEPMLVVQIVAGQGQIEGNLDPAQLETMKMDDLKKLAKEMQLEVPSKITKPELIKLISTEPVYVDKNDVNKDLNGGDEE